MKRATIALISIAAIAIAGCGRHGDGANGNAGGPAAKRAQLDPNPPMSSHDIDSIVAQSRRDDRPRRGAAAQTGAPTPASTPVKPATAR